MNALDDPETDHELVVVRQDAASGLRAIIAVHSRALGPAIGGCRVSPYATMSEALKDAVRLSRGMTYKCAIAGIPYGGGKAVILADPATHKTPSLLRAMGAFVDTLGGVYITSFDSGTTRDDVRIMGEATAFVAGIAEGYDDASASTAAGVLRCMAEAWHSRTGRTLNGAHVAIQGLGNVGRRLAGMLLDAGARLTVADVLRGRMTGLDAQVVEPARIHAVEADIFSPCALGAVLNARSIPELKARIVVGGANNQLESPTDARRLGDRGILYCPDYLANAGGIVELHHQRLGQGYDAVAAHLLSLADTLREVIRRAGASGLTTAEEADRIAEARFGKRAA